jgi:tetratricopeptide (TPR) repeat protein
MRVLLRLVQDAPAVVSRRTLFDEVWGDSFVTEDALSATVIKLRRAFGDDARSPSVVETVPKSGYRLIAPVSWDGHVSVEPEPSAPVPGGMRIATVVRCAVDISDPRPEVTDAEDWHLAMSETVKTVTDAVQRYGGWVSEESTGLLAVFGAPVAQEHHTERALSAAAALRYAPPVRSSAGLTVSVRLGVASGPVVVRDGLAGVPTAYGEPTRVASLLADAAAPGEVLVLSSDTATRQALVATEPAQGRIPGVDGEIHRLVAIERGMGHWDARHRQGLTPLRGRAEEMDQLETLLSRAAAGRGQVVAISGEPGVGKSRLLFELVRRSAARGFTTHVGHASPLDRHSPFMAWAGVMRALIGLDDQAALEGSVDNEALTAVLNPAEVQDEWATTDPELRQMRVVDAVMDTLLPSDVPTLIALEDVHWADEASLVLCQAIAARIARRPCLLVTTTRPGQDEGLAVRSYTSRLWVGALTPRQAEAMLDSLVGGHESLDDWKRHVLESAAGTPLFLEESVRAARATGVIIEARDGFHGAQTAAVAVPPSVQSLIAERIDRLATHERLLTCTAAVLGREVPKDVLRSVTPLDDEEWNRAVATLQREELLYETTARGKRALVFKHALTRDVAYAGIELGQRRELHRRAAQAIQTAGLDSPEALAWHLEESGADVAALHHWRRAADVAARAGGYRDALTHLERARALLPSIAETATRDRQELVLALSTGTALVQTVGPTDIRVERAYERAEALARSVGTATERFEAVWGSWFVQLMRGDLGRERELGLQIAELADLLDDDDSLSLEAHHVQWSGLTLAGRPHEAITHSSIGSERYRRDRDHWLTFSYGGHDPGVCAHNVGALARWLTADVKTAREHAEEAQALAESLGHAYSQLESVQAVMAMALLDGDHRSLKTHARRVLRFVEEERLPEVTAGYAHGFLGAAFAAQGRLPEAVETMSQAAPTWSEFWGAWCFPLDSAYAQVLAATGEVDSAIQHLESTLAWADDSGGTWWNAELIRTLAVLRMRASGDSRTAIDTLELAAHVAAEQGAHLLELRALNTLVEMPLGADRQHPAVLRLAHTVGRIPRQPDFPDLLRARALLTRAQA